MKTELTAAITQLSAERNLPKEVVIAALEAALVSAYKKDMSAAFEQDIWVKIDPDTAKIKFYTQKIAVESVADPDHEISVDEAQEWQAAAKVGDVVNIECKPKSIGRIAAQTARQTVLQRLREAEHRIIYEEFTAKEGEVVTGVVQFIEPKVIYVRLNRTEAVLPLREQIQNEHYYRGQRLKFYLLEMAHDSKGPQIIISRSHPNLIRRLFEMEIPEVITGIVELKAVAREAGYRTKVAVSTTQKSIEPVGCCIGPRGIRLQSIINELKNEKIDVIQWDADPRVFIANALSPSQVASVDIDEARATATVIVPDKQLSLAIGKEGQNARLAAKLTNWRIDIKSTSAAEAAKATLPVTEPKSIPIEIMEVAPVGLAPVEVEQEIAPVELMPVEVEQVEDVEDVEIEESTEVVATVETPIEGPKRKSQIRFAEDILVHPIATTKQGKGKTKAKGKGKGTSPKKQRSTIPDAIIDNDDK